MPIERFKDSYKNWRYNPFTGADMAADKEEDDLVIPSGTPFVVQLIESPRKNDPTSISVRAYDSETTVDANSSSGQKVLNVASTTGFASTGKVIINRGGAREEECVIDTVQAGVSLTMVDVLAETHTGAQADAVEEYIEYTEVSSAPAQSQFRVDYPVYPVNGEGFGTGLVEFNSGDASKVIRVNYKATGSVMTEEVLDTKVSFPAGDPVDNQVIAFVSGAPTWKYNPKPYFHEGSVIHHSLGEDESCLLFRFKRRAEDQRILLELKGAKLHQGFYTELFRHSHGVGTLANAAIGNHQHAKGSLAGSQPTHQHGLGTLAVVDSASHTHQKGTLAGTQPNHTHGLSGSTGNQSTNHSHVINTRDHVHDGCGGVDLSQSADGCSSPTATQSSSINHNHPVGTLAVGSDGNDAITITGATATGGVHSHGLTGSIAADGDDAVAVTGTTGWGGSHNHVISGSTANVGVTAKTYSDQLKIYINGVDRTTQVLALTGLTEFGNGSMGHAFVTTGSGEMDISSLVAAAQIHELKITEPTAGVGGRCLLHLELY